MKKVLILFICALVPIIFFGCENKNKNTLATPTDVSIQKGVIVFGTVENAEYYTIKVNNTELIVYATHSTNVSIVDNKINYNANKLFKVGESYSVQIKASASEMNDSAYSEAVSYKHNTAISKPEVVKINGTVLTWNAVANANYYLIKVVTPYNSKLQDKEGNPLTGDDSETIAKADLTEYSFSTNQFDFSSILTEAGNYNFYINAVSSDGTSISESGYTIKTTYKHITKLSTPSVGEVYSYNSQLHLNTILDPKANAIKITCNNESANSPLNNANQYVKTKENVTTINLSGLLGNKIDFNSPKQFLINIQAIHIVASTADQFYLDSETSSTVIYDKTQQLVAPELTVSNIKLNTNHNEYEIKWRYTSDLANVSKFRVYIYNGSEILTYYTEKSNSQTNYSVLLPSNVQSAAVQAVGLGNYTDSKLTNFVSTNSVHHTISASSVNVRTNKNTINWNPDNSALFMVEYNSKCTIINENSHTINTETLSSAKIEASIYVFKPNHLVYKQTLNEIDCTTKLAAPTITEHQGFKSTNPYLLTFTGSPNALGYVVYIKQSTATTYEMIDTVFTSTSINLYQYIVSQNKYVTYDIRLQAIADSRVILEDSENPGNIGTLQNTGKYQDSELSAVIKVTRSSSLGTPEFASEPITKITSGERSIYYLNFYGVQNAHEYEILINYNKISIVSKGDDYIGIYKVDISQYLLAANNYNIKIRAVPLSDTESIVPSKYNTTNYTVTKQLQQVTDINVNHSNGVYTLTFTPVENAVSYNIRIVKLADNNYYEKLKAKGLPHPLSINKSTDISRYLTEQGQYYIYITAIASKLSNYGNSDESGNFAIVDKLETLTKPYSITTENNSESSYILSWQGDSHADYYSVSITDTYGFEKTFTVTKTQCNINNYLTVPGNYSVRISSMVETDSENAANYISSPSTVFDIAYSYTQDHDFKRHKISLYGHETNYVVNNFEDLKTILWYHYLYNSNVSIYIQPNENEDVKDAILRFADEAEYLYDFTSDGETWISLTSGSALGDLFEHICKKILECYPELNVLNYSYTHHEDLTNIFELSYSNALNTTKVYFETDSSYGTLKDILIDTNASFTPTNYANKFSYLGKNVRRGTSSIFAIESRPEKLVETTEQLIQAIEYGFKPKFYGNSEVAEKVYLNAKKVLVSIISDNMNQTTKATRIFDWISYAYNLNLYADKTSTTNIITDADLSVYGLRADYYLEGMLYNLSTEAAIGSPTFDGEFNLINMYATNHSYTKLFNLLCGIENIKSVTTYGSYEGKPYNWNRVYLGNKWFNVDLTASDNFLTSTSAGISVASHAYFLVADGVMAPKQVSDVIQSTIVCGETYDYYANNMYHVSKDVITEMIDNGNNNYFVNNDMNISKLYKKFEPSDSNKYENYGIGGYSDMQAMLVNLMLYAYNNMIDNKCNFEFSFTHDSVSYSENANGLVEVDRIKEIATDNLPTYSNIKLLVKNVKLIIDNSNGRTIVVASFEKG